jgi:uncharacterized protein
MEFEWDEEKAVANLRKHGVAFVDAAEALRSDRLVVEKLDMNDDYGEERTIAFAMLGDVILMIVFTMRGEIYRLISARRADRDEQHYYYRENHA